jgi:hypothetical protein
MEKFKGFLVILILLVVGFGIWFFFIKEDKDVSEFDSNPDYDMSDVTNVPVIDRKLGNDIEITQSYLMTYTVHKAGIWYMSEGYVSNVKVSNQSIIYTISNEDNSKSVMGTIVNDGTKYNKGDKVYFVGTINLSNGMLNLSTISNDVIDYSSPVERELNEFIDHIDNVRNTNFIIDGYMVTDNDEYKLFDSKSDYLDNSEAGNYFLLSMDESFNYTGNANVTLKCNINGTYNLRNCSLVQ